MKNLKFLPLIVLSFFSFSCKKDKTPEDKPGSYVLGPKTVIIDNSTSLVLESVDSVKVVFDGNTTQLESLTVGSIIVSGITTNAPYGFLRKITNIQKSGTIYTFTTVEVPLEEAFEELHVDYTKTFSTSDTARRVTGTNFTIDLPNMVLYDGDGNNSTTIDQIKLNENVEITPSFRFAVDISRFKLQYAIVEGNYETILDQSIVAGGSVGSMSKEVNIFEKPLAAYPLPGLPFLVVVPNLRVSLGATASINVSVTASQKITSNINAFIEYKNSTWDKDYTQTMHTTHNFSGINGNASVKVYVEPAIDFKLYNSNWAKGSISAQGYLKATGTLLPTPDCELKAGLSAGAEANLKFFGWGFTTAFYPDIFDYSKVLYTCIANQTPIADFSASQTNITTGSSVNFIDLSTGNPTSWSWNFQGGVPATSSLQNPTNIQYNTAGTYAVTLVATNANGNDTKTKTGYIVVSDVNPQLPTLTTNAVTNQTNATATSGGNISNQGASAVTARGVCWSTSQNPTIANSKTINGSGTGSFTSNLTSLTANTTYYVRAYATNSYGTAYGNEISFNLNIGLPTIITTPVTNVTLTSINSGGKITNDGGSSVTERGVCWRKYTSSDPPTINNNKIISGIGTGTFSSTISGLTPNTLYLLRAYATNANSTAYGATHLFYTLSSTGNLFTQGAGVSDIDGNFYSTIILGTQEWMAENLRTTKYCNGDAIPNLQEFNQWFSTTEGAWCYYNNINYDNDYGKLYNGFTVTDARNICPCGWHVPSRTEYDSLYEFIASFDNDPYGLAFETAALKETGTTHWFYNFRNSFGGTNASGFNGTPGGMRDQFVISSYYGMGIAGYWWTASASTFSTLWAKTLTNIISNSSEHRNNGLAEFKR